MVVRRPEVIQLSVEQQREDAAQVQQWLHYRHPNDVLEAEAWSNEVKGVEEDQDADVEECQGAEEDHEDPSCSELLDRAAEVVAAVLDEVLPLVAAVVVYVIDSVLVLELAGVVAIGFDEAEGPPAVRVPFGDNQRCDNEASD